jgi:lysophospholipase L1-like esterase
MNVATGNATYQAKLVSLRAYINSAALSVDAGGTIYAVNLPALTAGALTIFEDSTDAGDTTYYQADGVHLNATGYKEEGRGYKEALAANW